MCAYSSSLVDLLTTQVVIFAVTSVLAFLIFLSVYSYFKFSFSYWKRRNIPYIEPTTPFGNIRNDKSWTTLTEEFYQIFKEQRHGVGGIYSFTMPMLILTKPDHIKHILVKNFQNFQNKGLYYANICQPYAINLFIADGERWKTIRTKFAPAFSQAKLKNMLDLITEATGLMENSIEKHAVKKQPVNISECTNQFTMDILVSCVLGMDISSLKDVPLNDIFRKLIDSGSDFIKLTISGALPRLANFFKVPVFPLKEATFIYKCIDDTIRYRTAKNVSRSDFLQFLIEIKQKGFITMDELVGQCMGFFIGTNDTTATAMALVLFELAQDEELQGKLRNQIEQVLENRDGRLNHEAITEMKYLEMVLAETLRKYPNVPMLTRKCVRDFHLPDTDILIEKGTTVIVPVSGLHSDPQYFPNPEKFDPERFSEQNKSQIAPYTYLPFGDGPRYCIGERFGKLIIKVGLVEVIRKYRFKLNKDTEVPLKRKSIFLFGARDDILLDMEKI